MSLESLWVMWKRHHHQTGYLIVGLVAFAAGWQLGRVTSPYYAAHPIVFQAAPGEAVKENNGSAEALVALQKAGQQEGAAPTQVTAARTIEPTLPVGEGTPKSQGEEQRMFAGSKNSSLYHHKECPGWRRIKEENIRWWPTRAAAEAAGYKPSKCTQEMLNAL